MFVLASASKARQKLLNQIGLRYKVIVSDFDESIVNESDPCLKVKSLAKEKANSVFEKLLKENQSTISFSALLGCDSLFEFEGEIFGKPRNKDELISRWERMSGRSGFLHTGHCLIPIEKLQDNERILVVGRSLIGVVSTKIEFMHLSNNEIRKYASLEEPYQCAGGFAIEGKGGIFIKNIHGCFSNVIGLSLPWLKLNLEKCGLCSILFKN